MTEKLTREAPVREHKERIGSGRMDGLWHWYSVRSLQSHMRDR